MRFFFNPLIFLFELIAFAIQAVVAYGFLIIVCIGIIWYGISTMPKEPEVIYYETVVEKTVEKEPTLTCDRIAGCEVFPNAVTENEYCPTCTMK